MKTCACNILAFILKPNVSAVKYFPFALTKPNVQLNLSSDA